MSSLASVQPAYPVELECDALASDGTVVHVRPIRPADAEALVAFHEGLSAETVYRRFFSTHPHLSPREVERFTNVDYVHRLALVAEVRGDLVAVGRYDRDPGSPEAEVAFVVADAYHGRGLGTLLLELLAAAARHRGVRRFVAQTLWSNREMLRVFAAAGFGVESHTDAGVVELAFSIDVSEPFVEALSDRDARAARQSLLALLEPRAVTIAGAGTGAEEVLANLRSGGYTGAVHRLGAMTAPPGADLARWGELAVIDAEPGELVEWISWCGRQEIAVALVVSTGGSSDGASASGPGASGPGDSGRRAERRLLAAARAGGVRVVGPDSLGAANTAPGCDFNALVSPGRLRPGRIGVSTQSRVRSAEMLGRLTRGGVGVSSFVSVGERLDVSGNDLLSYWTADPATDVIALCLESFGNPRRFARLSRLAALTKPVVALWDRPQLCGGAPRAAPAEDQVVDALFGQSGVIPVATMAELVATAAVLASDLAAGSGAVALLARAGAPAAAGIAALSGAGLRLAVVSSAVAAELAARPAVVATAPAVEVDPAAPLRILADIMRVVRADPGVDVVMVVAGPVEPFTASELATRLGEPEAGGGRDLGVGKGVGVGKDVAKMVVAAYPGIEGADGAHRADVHVGADHEPVVCSSAEQAARALARAVAYRRWRKRPAGRFVPLAGVDSARARTLVDDALGTRPDPGDVVTLDPAGSADLLAAYGLPLRPPPAGDRPQVVVMNAVNAEVFGPLLTLVAPDAGPGSGAGATAGDPAAGSTVGLPPLTDLDAIRLAAAVAPDPLRAGADATGNGWHAAMADLILRAGQLIDDIPEVVHLRAEIFLDDGRPVLAAPVDVALGPPAAAIDPLIRRLT